MKFYKRNLEILPRKSLVGGKMNWKYFFKSSLIKCLLLRVCVRVWVGKLIYLLLPWFRNRLIIRLTSLWIACEADWISSTRNRDPSGGGKVFLMPSPPPSDYFFLRFTLRSLENIQNRLEAHFRTLDESMEISLKISSRSPWRRMLDFHLICIWLALI